VPECERVYPEKRCFGTPLPAHEFYLRHADGVFFDNMKVKVDGNDLRPAFVTDDCTEIRSISPKPIFDFA
jgi:hypothetical protein